MKDMQRQIRRAHVKRLKQKRKFYWGYGKPHYQCHLIWVSSKEIYYKLISKRGITEMDAKQANKVAQNSQLCSCMGCGNGRRYFGKTLSELSWNALADDQMKELE